MTREEFLIQLPNLVKDYKPAPDVVDHIRNISVLMIVGPSGVGKTTLIDNLNLKHVPSDNTRSPRSGEAEGVDFYFRTDYQKMADEIKNGQFVQVAIDGSGDLKATKASSYPESGDVVMAVVSDVVPIFRSLGFKKTITTFITPPSYGEWMRRLSSHKLPQDQLEKRLAEAERSLNFALNDGRTHFILSEDVQAAVTQIKKLLSGEIDQTREQKAKLAAQELTAKLGVK